MAWLLLFTLVPLLGAMGLVMLLGVSLGRLAGAAAVGVLGFVVWFGLTRAFGANPDTCHECTTTIGDTEVRYATMAGLLGLACWIIGLLLGSIVGAIFGRIEDRPSNGSRSTSYTTH